MALRRKHYVVFFRIRSEVGMMMHHLSLRLCGVTSECLDKLWKVLTGGISLQSTRCSSGEVSSVEVFCIDDMRHTIVERSNTLPATSSVKEGVVA